MFLSQVFWKDQYGLSGKDLRVTPMLDWVYEDLGVARAYVLELLR